MEENTELKLLLEKISNSPSPLNELELQNIFDDVAINLLNKSILIVGDAQYSIQEIEFYFWCKNNHEDPYVHQANQQGKFAMWYLHSKAKNPEKYPRNGLDLTFGNKKSDMVTFGGILLRQLQRIPPIPNGNIQGPGRITKHLASILKEDFKKIDEMNALSSTSDIFISAAERHCINTIYRTSRKLEKVNEKDPNEEFYNKKYRYFNYPEIEEVWPKNSTEK